MVAEATSALCEAANAAVQGNASQEKLVASAQAVSASTAQLLLACRVKADPNSKAQRGLQVNVPICFFIIISLFCKKINSLNASTSLASQYCNFTRMNKYCKV